MQLHISAQMPQYASYSADRNSSVRDYSSIQKLPSVISLFSGAGGLDWGFGACGFNIALAVDKSTAAVRTHRKNHKAEKLICADLIQLGSRGVCDLLAETVPLRSSIGVIGGPPCQGFSRGNSDSRPDDPRNRLVNLYLDIVAHLNQQFEIEFVVFENVMGIKDKKHQQTYQSLLRGLESLNLRPTEFEICALDYGIAQVRKRVILIAMRNDCGYEVPKIRRRNGVKTLREAIGHLGSPVFYRPGLNPAENPIHPNHWTMRPRSWRFSIAPEFWRAGRSFRRTFWDKPSPTIAFGHREIHIHPGCKRRLSIYEAMLLQGFPANYVLEGNLSEQVEQISNAVPPPIASSVASSISRVLRRSRA
jgi:DNA (cytosine-5)-methyltransferase 1